MLLILLLSFLYVRGRFNPGLWDEQSDEIDEPKPPTYNDFLESELEILERLGVEDKDYPPPTFNSGLK